MEGEGRKEGSKDGGKERKVIGSKMTFGRRTVGMGDSRFGREGQVRIQKDPVFFLMSKAESCGWI
jgi:hypothetical protein